MSSTWHAHVRIEHNGQYAEYNDRIDALSPDNQVPTAADITAEVADMVINAAPHLKGGTTTHSSARRIS